MLIHVPEKEELYFLRSVKLSKIENRKTKAMLVEKLAVSFDKMPEYLGTVEILNHEELPMVFRKNAEKKVQQPVYSAIKGMDIPESIRPILTEISKLTQIQDIFRRVELCRQALSMVNSGENQPLWAALSVELGNSLNQNPIGNRAANIDDAIHCYEQALKVMTRSAMPMEWALATMNLATAYNDRIRGDRADNIEEAIRCYEQALEVRNRHSIPVEWATTKMNLANAYYCRIRKDRSDNIEKAIRYYEQALEVMTRDAMPVEWASARMNLANAYRDRIRGDRAENIEKAVRYFEQSLEVTTRNVMPFNWAMIHMNLANAYAHRIRGDRADNIEEAIWCCKQALEVRTREAIPIDWAITQMNLANAFTDRIRGNRTENIEEAISCYKKALEVITRDAMPVEWATAKLNMANTYARRIRGDREDNIEKAIQCYEQTLEVNTRESMPVEWAEAMMNLAQTYNMRILGDHAANIEKAIRYFKKSLEVISRDALPLKWATANMNLAIAYSDRIQGDRADNIEKAIQCYRQVLEVRTLNAMPIEWAQATTNLATAYYSRIQGDHSDNIDVAIHYYERALEVRTCDAMPSSHRQTQQNLGNLCITENRRTKATKAFIGMLAANEILYKTAVLPESRQLELREIRGIATRMAYSLLKSATSDTRPDAMKQAVEELEKNRARWLSEALSLKSGKPESVPDAVWNDFERYRNDYNELLIESRLPEDTPGRRKFIELGTAMRKTLEMLDTALLKVRNHEPAFMPNPNFEQILSAVASEREALIYIAVTPVGSVAFLVRSEDDPIIHIWLDSLLEKTLNENIQQYLNTYREWRTNSKDFEVRNNWFNTLNAVTNWLWVSLMGPLIEKLVASGTTNAILIPQGLLGLLPLHAAWTEENGKRRYAMDYVCYSYAPNALSLVTCRKIAKQSQSERMLAIDEPYMENAGPLPNSNAEVTAICHHFTEKTVLADEKAMRKAVSDALSDHDVFHFSCHGMADFTEPLNSGLLMANGETLTLRDFLSTEGINARLAVLSACETGIPDLKNADEAIGLPAGLVQAGVAGVVASIWSVSDLSTMMLMVRFYELWRKDNLEPPESLRQAQIWVRDTTNGQKAEYFGGFLPEFGKTDNQHLPVHLADMLYKEFIAKNQDENDFEHPFYWAAFGYTGV